MSRPRPLLVFALALAALLAIAPGARVRPGITITAVAYGATTLALDPAAAAALTGLGVTPAPVAPARALPSGELAFPIQRTRSATRCVPA